MTANTYDVLASMRARYWDTLAGHRAALAGEATAAEQPDRRARRSLLPEHPALEREQLLHCGNSTAAHDTTPHAHSWAAERASVSNRGAAAHGMGETERDMPLKRWAARQRCMHSNQNTTDRQVPASIAGGRGELIASIVETGLQIATRMGDRAAAAALGMPKPRAISSPAARARPFTSGFAKAGPDASPGTTPALPGPAASKLIMPAPGILAGHHSAVNQALQHGTDADTSGKAAHESTAVSEQEPSLPDKDFEASPPKYQGVLSGAQRERLRQWMFLDGHTTVRERARHASNKKARAANGPRRSSARRAARGAQQNHATAPEVRTPGRSAAESLQHVGGPILETPSKIEQPYQQAQAGKRKRQALQNGSQIFSRRKGLRTTSSSDMHQQVSQKCTADGDIKCSALEGQREPEISSSTTGDCAGCSSARLTRGSTALQRLASIALKL